MFQTEHEFQLPMGYLDPEGILHRDGVMRLATASDEIDPLRDPRVRQNEAYLSVILMSRVVIRLGSLQRVTPNIIEGLFAADLEYLQRLYNDVNRLDGAPQTIACPRCECTFDLREEAPVSVGGSLATPSPSSPRK